MWISKKRLQEERVGEFQLGLKLGIAMGRNQIRREFAAAIERKRRAVAEAATVEKPQTPKA